jgi:hypothetical protein
VQYAVTTVRNRRTLNDFLRLPFTLYRGDERWIAPLASEVSRTLDAARNPYFGDASLDLLVCYADGRPVARTALVANRKHWEKFGERAAFFGFFESVNDRVAVRSLFELAEVVALARGAQYLEGPFNPNHYSELGLQVSRFGTPPAFFQPYNPEYYAGLLDAAGFRSTKTIHTRKNTHIREYIRQRYGTVSQPASSGTYSVRSFRMDHFEADLERVREVFNDAFSSNWHFLPLTSAEYVFSAKFLNLVTRPELITLVEHEGRPVGVLECVLDINPLLKRLNGSIGPMKYLRYLYDKNDVRSLIIYAVGIKRAYQGTRVYKLLLDSLCAQANAYDSLETTWMSEDNHLALRAADHLGLERDKEFAIYQRDLHPQHSRRRDLERPLTTV